MSQRERVPDGHYTPLVRDSARHWLSVDTGFKRRRFNFDIAYQFGFGDGVRTVSGSAPSAQDTRSMDAMNIAATPS